MLSKTSDKERKNCSNDPEKPTKCQAQNNFPDDSEKPAKCRAVASNVEKIYASRLEMFKEAGQRMIEEGETTRVTVVNPKKK